jgi:hypothetical protein
VNTSEHTTAMDGGREGSQNHSVAKRIGEKPTPSGRNPLRCAVGNLLALRAGYNVCSGCRLDRRVSAGAASLDGFG